MELLLFRHGPAGDRDKWAKTGKPDDARPLTSDGRVKTAKAAEGLTRILARLDVIAASPLLRARQTADALADAFPKARRVELAELAQDTPAGRVLEKLEDLRGERAALVGHEPQLSALAGELIGGDARLELKKAGACLLDVRAPRRGGATLLWLLRPSQLRALR